MYRVVCGISQDGQVAWRQKYQLGIDATIA